jgi:hypothetical protein
MKKNADAASRGMLGTVAFGVLQGGVLVPFEKNVRLSKGEYMALGFLPAPALGLGAV